MFVLVEKGKRECEKSGETCRTFFLDLVVFVGDRKDGVCVWSGSGCCAQQD